MSELCVGVINKMPGGRPLIQMKDDVIKLCEHNGIEITWQVQVEPFMTEEMIQSGAVFELTRNRVAETLLCPDWCQYNGLDSEESFAMRMKKIESILHSLLKYVPSVDLYIGDRDALRDDYEYLDVNCDEFALELTSLFELHAAWTPQVCLHVTNEGHLG